MSDTPGVLVSGGLIHDTLVYPADDAAWGTTTFVETLEPHPGGNGANTSLAVAKAGGRVRVIGVVGDDPAGQVVLDALRTCGVDTGFVLIRHGLTAATVGLVNRAGDRRFLHRAGIAAEAFSEPVEFTPALVEGMAHYHLSSLFILPRFRAHGPETLARARAAGLTTSFDTNWDPQGRWMEDVAPCLPHLDFVFMNEDEARMTTGSSEPETAARRLLDGGARTAVIKLGGRGCLVLGEGIDIRTPAFAVEVKDTTGAGDSFVGGFLAALVRGAPLAEAARWGNAMGALCVRHVGGAAGIAGGLDLEGWMRTARRREAL